MRSRPSSLAAALACAAALALGCSSSTPKPADDPGEAKDAPPPDSTPPASTGEKADEAKDAPPPMLKNGPAKDESVPDDYELTPGDCDALGKQYGRLARGDQLAALNPKLTQAQRETAESNIDRAIAPLEGRWIDGCVASLAGKVSNRASLKCAMDAKTVKAFDVCLNGEGGTAPADPKPGAAPKKKK
ncbi:MAG: hypothetical protein U0359_10455 [Byssovorax sp.]